MNPMGLLRLPIAFIRDVLTLADLKRDRATFREKAVALELERDVLRTRCSDLGAQVANLQAQLADLAAECAQLRAQGPRHQPQRSQRGHDPYENL